MFEVMVHMLRGFFQTEHLKNVETNNFALKQVSIKFCLHGSNSIFMQEQIIEILDVGYDTASLCAISLK